MYWRNSKLWRLSGRFHTLIWRPRDMVQSLKYLPTCQLSRESWQHCLQSTWKINHEYSLLSLTQKIKKIYESCSTSPYTIIWIIFTIYIATESLPSHPPHYKLEFKSTSKSINIWRLGIGRAWVTVASPQTSFVTGDNWGSLKLVKSQLGVIVNVKWLTGRS